MNTNPRRLAAVVHDVLGRGSFETLADLADVVKHRAANLRIPYDSGTVTEAFRLVSRTRPLLVPLTVRQPRRLKGVQV